MLFSQRYGFKPVREMIQRESIDEALKNGLWNALFSCYWSKGRGSYDSLNTIYGVDILIQRIWLEHLQQSIDSLSDRWSVNYQKIRKYFFECSWYSVYDFIEFVAQNDITMLRSQNTGFRALCNAVLEKEMSAYRFVGKYISEITSENEITEIEEAMSNSGPMVTVQQHLQTALALMADKKQPDYRNSIKESISALESICKIITQNQSATLGQALNQIEKSGQVELNPALKEAYSKLYGYTSNADGIRHALKEQSNVSYEDAKYMLVSCSAFINYLISKSTKAGLDLN